jgi:hypothetical protein
MDTKTLWAGLLGISIGAAAAVASRSHWEAWAAGSDCCKTRSPSAGPLACPARYDNGKLVLTDAAAAESVRKALFEGVLVPWFELGRAPTPEETGARLGLDAAATDSMLDTLEACGEDLGFGIRRAPNSRIIAFAWPLSNVPTGITVTLEGGKPVHARCAIDALGVSKMMGKRAVVEATTKDGEALRVEIDGDKLVSSTLPGAIVQKGSSCDEMNFFSSGQALEAWKKGHAVEGKSFGLADAVQHGAGIFGRFSRPAAEAMAP